MLKCLSGIGVYYNQTTKTCTGSDAANAIEVQQQATVPLIFAQWFGVNSVTLSATALASVAGGLPPLHVMIVVDNTGSMNGSDTSSPKPTNCGFANPTRIQCALAAVQTLLSELWPTQDEVGLMVFPPVTSGTAANDADCSASTKPTIANYGAAGSTYQILGLGTTYKTTNTATTLNIKSGNLAAAVCQSGQSVTLPSGATNSCGTCAGLYVGSSSTTYLAGAINAAQNVLNANSVSGVQNVMIVLSDGGAGDGTGGPANNQCVNSVTAAQNAANAGTWIYSVAYQSSPVLSNSTVVNGCGRSNQTGLQTNCTCSDTEIARHLRLPDDEGYRLGFNEVLRRPNGRKPQLIIPMHVGR